MAPRADKGVKPKGVEDFPPNTLAYSNYLDRVSGHDRAPQWRVSRTQSEGALSVKTAAHRYQPGQYKVDRDFVEDKTREVRKEVLTTFETPKRWKFGDLSKLDQDGVLAGIRNPNAGTRWFNPTGPGHYVGSPVSHLESAPSWSVRKGMPQEEVRERRLMGTNP